MLVENAIKRLEKMNPKAELRLHDKNGEDALFFLSLLNNDDIVWIESESDVDMANEIQARFDDAIENGIDEIDVYSDMLEVGIDVDMVRRNMGDEVANKMEEFCEEHGVI